MKIIKYGTLFSHGFMGPGPSSRSWGERGPKPILLILYFPIFMQLDGSTHPCTVDVCGGGVARNMAEALWRMRGGGVRLLTAIGDDADGQYILDIVPGLLLNGCIIKSGRTASYAAVLDAKGECRLGLGHMDLHNHITIDMVNKHIGILEEAPLVIFDGNMPQDTMQHVLQLCNKMKKPVFFEPTDQRKAIKPLLGNAGPIFATPNLSELHAMASFLKPGINITDSNEVDNILKLCKVVSEAIPFLIVTMGSKGVITVKNFKKCNLEAKLYTVELLENIVNVSGAGDCFASGFINGMLAGQRQSSCIKLGFEAAKSALMCNNTVPKHFLQDYTNKKNYYTKLDMNSFNSTKIYK
ncbi:hypothetical protein evm_010569 [Chilo suppressalis]|nr:hypothetical protein evm_010569 [Chilo suppressalis]